MMKKFFALCLLVVATLSVSAKEIKEFIVTTTPQMSCQNCENKIKKNLRFEKGVTNIQTDLANQIVVVTYDAEKTNEANLTKAFEKIDYIVTPAATKSVAIGTNAKAAAAKSCSKACDAASGATVSANAAEAHQCKGTACKKACADCKAHAATKEAAATCKKADAACKKADAICKKADAKIKKADAKIKKAETEIQKVKK